MVEPYVDVIVYLYDINRHNSWCSLHLKCVLYWYLVRLERAGQLGLGLG